MLAPKRNQTMIQTTKGRRLNDSFRGIFACSRQPPRTVNLPHQRSVPPFTLYSICVDISNIFIALILTPYVKQGSTRSTSTKKRSDDRNRTDMQVDPVNVCIEILNEKTRVSLCLSHSISFFSLFYIYE